MRKLEKEREEREEKRKAERLEMIKIGENFKNFLTTSGAATGMMLIIVLLARVMVTACPHSSFLIITLKEGSDLSKVTISLPAGGMSSGRSVFGISTLISGMVMADQALLVSSRDTIWLEAVIVLNDMGEIQH